MNHLCVSSLESFPWRSEYSWYNCLCLCFSQDCCICSHCQVVSWWGVLCNSWEGIWFNMLQKDKLLEQWCFYIMYVDACVSIRRMTVYLRCGIPPRAGVLQWWSTTPPIKSLFLFTSPLFTWPILDRSLVCPGGRPASTCPSKIAHTQSHGQGGQWPIYLLLLFIFIYKYMFFVF